MSRLGYYRFRLIPDLWSTLSQIAASASGRSRTAMLKVWKGLSETTVIGSLNVRFLAVTLSQML